ncbi:NADPH-dependent FMN reductase [Nocardia sp. NPDC004711]
MRADRSVGSPAAPAGRTRPGGPHPHTRRFAEHVGSCAAFIFVTGEYNTAPPSSLTNCIDLYAEWPCKPVADVGYGPLTGYRSPATTDPYRRAGRAACVMLSSGRAAGGALARSSDVSRPEL